MKNHNNLNFNKFKSILLLFILTILLLLCFNGCREENKSTADTNASYQDNDALLDSSEEPEESNGLTLLSDSVHSDSYNTKEGRYYVSLEKKETEDGSCVTNIMYVDYETKQEIFLCSQPDCKHDNSDCTSVIPETTGTSYLFGDGKYLYLVITPYDNDGSMEVSTIEEGYEEGLEIVSSSEEKPVIYRMNLDGTNREKVFTLDSGMVMENIYIGDGSYLYVITKKLSSKTKKNKTFTSSYDRTLMQLDLEKGTSKKMVSLETDQAILGCSGRTLVIGKTDYGKELTIEEKHDDAVFKKAYENSTYEIEGIDIDTGKTVQYKKWKQNKEHSQLVKNGVLYLSREKEKKIYVIDLKTNQENVVALKKSYRIENVIDEKMIGADWTYKEKYFVYFINMETREETKSTLRNQYSTPIDIIAETDDSLFVVSDYQNITEYVAWMDLYQEVTDSYTYSLISKEDYFANKGNYSEVTMQPLIEN